MRQLIIGSRGSALALAQANWVAEQIRTANPAVDVEIRIIKTSGDKILDVPLAKIGGKGLFVKEIEVALLDSSIDLAVHSMKDLPTEVPAGLCVAAVPARAEQCDALIGSYSSLDELPIGAKVGTSSLRRRSQLKHYRSDLEILDLRGNLDTRLKKLDSGDYDAIVLACAGLQRLGLASRISQRLPTEVSVPAVGQGALAIEARVDNAYVLELLRSLDDDATRRAVESERALLASLGGGCQVPIGAAASVDGHMMEMIAMVGDVDGETVIVRKGQGSAAEPEALGKTMASELLEAGAKRILESVAEISNTGQVGAA